jgi:hypothetical protein
MVRQALAKDYAPVRLAKKSTRELFALFGAASGGLGGGALRYQIRAVKIAVKESKP